MFGISKEPLEQNTRKKSLIANFTTTCQGDYFVSPPVIVLLQLYYSCNARTGQRLTKKKEKKKGEQRCVC